MPHVSSSSSLNVSTGSDDYTGDGSTGDRGMGDDVAKCQLARGSGSMLTIDVFPLDNLNNGWG